MWARLRQVCFVEEGKWFHNLSEADKCGRGFARARFRQHVCEMSFTNVGEVLPVLFEWS